MKFKSVIILFVISLVLLVGCSTKNESVSKNVPIEPIRGSFSFDVRNLNAVVGEADYVFVAYVNSETKTIYKRQISMMTEKGIKEVSTPYTEYSITVIDNIKGKLKKNVEIGIQKIGGLVKDRSKIVIGEGDELLTVGSYQIITAYAQTDGSLLSSGPNSSVLLKYDNKSAIMSSEEYKKYENAFKNEENVTNRKRFKSINEE